VLSLPVVYPVVFVATSCNFSEEWGSGPVEMKQAAFLPLVVAQARRFSR
jgi:hypothetical protein